MTTLSTLLRENAIRNPDRLALSVDNHDLTYGELLALVQPVVGWLRTRVAGKVPRVGVLASRNWAAYAGILGTSMAGGTYVPIHPDCPEDRILRILDAAALDALIVDDRGLKTVSPTVAAACPPHILSPASDSSLSIDSTAPSREVSGKDSLSSGASDLAPVEPDANRLAYIMFTSGTTGWPKGVMISEGNVASFLSAMRQHFPFEATDRVPQTFELTFDLSVWSMLAAWGAGASLHVVPAGQLMGPSQFIREKQLTVWLSVPSTISCMRSLKMLTPGAFPSLRYSGFCGEPLPAASAEAWQRAAPNSVVDNVYGPTEATIACLSQIYSDPRVITKERGFVAIGKPFYGMQAAVVDSANALDRLRPRED